MGLVDNVVSGGATGGSLGAAIGIAPSIFKLIQGIGQRNKANSLHPTDPGYQMNQGVIDNAKTSYNNYLNYQMPGSAQAQNNINNTYSSAFSSGVNGAGDSGDVLDLASKLAYGKNNALMSLATQNAQGKEGALNTYMNNNAAAGQEYVNKNAYDRDMYDRIIRQKAALTQSGAENTFGAVDQIGSVVSKALLPKNNDEIDYSKLTPAQSASLKATIAKYQ